MACQPGGVQRPPLRRAPSPLRSSTKRWWAIRKSRIRHRRHTSCALVVSPPSASRSLYQGIPLVGYQSAQDWELPSIVQRARDPRMPRWLGHIRARCEANARIARARGAALYAVEPTQLSDASRQRRRRRFSLTGYGRASIARSALGNHAVVC